MSRRYTAKCWMGSSSGYVDIEVNASTINGAKEQLQNIYGAEQIINLREVRNRSSGSGIPIPSGSTGLILTIFGGAALFLYFTPWVLMTVYGAGATWITQKVTGQTIDEYVNTEDENTSSEQHKKIGIVLGSALLFGMIGFIQGTSLNNEFNKEYNLDGKQSNIENVRKN